MGTRKTDLSPLVFLYRPFQGDTSVVFFSECWACAVKICHDGMLEDTNLLDGAHLLRYASLLIDQDTMIYFISRELSYSIATS